MKIEANYKINMIGLWGSLQGYFYVVIQIL